MPCLIVRHRGARRLTLRAGPWGVRLTVPTRTPERAVTGFLSEHAGWIAANLPAARPPGSVAPGTGLALLDDTLTLRLRTGVRIGVRRVGDELRVRLPDGSDPSPVIERWYRREASARLRTMAERWASPLGVGVAGVAIRDPRSRWGSCSPSGRLSFSWRLLLAPGFVAEHVAAHEVCHLVRPDHSPAFWRLLGDLDPLTPQARAWLRAHGARLHDGPTWRNGAPAGALIHGAAGPGRTAPQRRPS